MFIQIYFFDYLSNNCIVYVPYQITPVITNLFFFFIDHETSVVGANFVTISDFI